MAQWTMDHPNILGEVYGIVHLRSIVRVANPFSILTCFDQWRICWLDREESNRRAAFTTLPDTVGYATPVKAKSKRGECTRRYGFGR